jgi:cyclopropane-fatty-acyl-phospholipid synthase
VLAKPLHVRFSTRPRAQQPGEAQAWIWRLYMAASALNFEAERTAVHQVLAVKNDAGARGLPLRPRI